LQIKNIIGIPHFFKHKYFCRIDYCLSRILSFSFRLSKNSVNVIVDFFFHCTKARIHTLGKKRARAIKSEKETVCKSKDAERETEKREREREKEGEGEKERGRGRGREGEREGGKKEGEEGAREKEREGGRQVPLKQVEGRWRTREDRLQSHMLARTALPEYSAHRPLDFEVSSKEEAALAKSSSGDLDLFLSFLIVFLSSYFSIIKVRYNNIKDSCRYVRINLCYLYQTYFHPEYGNRIIFSYKILISHNSLQH